MEQNKELLELLKSMEEANRKQARYLKITAVLALAAVVCFAGIFLLVYDFLPQINGIVTQLGDVMTQLPGMVSQMELVLDNLETVTTELAAVDFGSLIDGVNTLVQTGQDGLTGTVEKLETIDFDSLNKTIKDLAEVVEPLAKFFKSFR